MDEPASKTLRNFMRIYGIEEGSLKRWRIAFITILNFYMTSQAILALYMNWNDIILRFQALEDVESNLFCMTFYLEHTFAPWIVQKELSMIDEPYYDYGVATDLRIKEIRTRSLGQKQQIAFFIRAVLFYTFTLYIPPLIVACFKILSGFKEEEIQFHLLFPSECWFPFNINAYIYILIYSYNIFYAVTLFHNVCAYMGAPIGVQYRITTELRLFKISLQEIDQICFIYRENDEGLNVQSEESKEMCLKYYLKHLVQHHNFIYRQLKEINTALSLSALSVIKSTTVMGCLSMYCMFEMEEKHNKIKYFSAIIVLFLILFAYSMNGQNIQDQGEEIRYAMYSCSWLDKPLWFKRSLLTMMTRANRITEIKPMGLYVLDYQNVSSIANAAYVYCNFLRTTRK